MNHIKLLPATLALFWASFALSTAVSGVEERIAYEGSAHATYGQFPNLVSIHVNDEHLCGGWIYNERWVVTCASCVESVNMSLITVIAGTLRLFLPDPDEVELKVVQVQAYGPYNNVTGLHNIALLQTDKAMDLTTVGVGVRALGPVSSPRGSATIAGWGSTAEDGPVVPNLRWANITLASNPECKIRYIANFDGAYQICTSDKDVANACDHDEGGPVMQNDIVVGMISLELGGCNSFTPAGLVRVSAYESWLKQIAGPQPAALIPNLSSS